MTDIDGDEDGVEFIDHDPSEQEIDRAGAADTPRALVVVENLDDSEQIRFWIRFDAKVKRAITRAYKRLDVSRADGDRLAHAESGDSVFADESLTIRKYILKYGGKARVHWHYSGATGGA